MTLQSYSWAYTPRENHNSKRYMHPYVHCSTIYNKEMNKDDMVHIYNGTLATKQNKIRPFAAIWMDL